VNYELGDEFLESVYENALYMIIKGKISAIISVNLWLSSAKTLTKKGGLL